MARSRSFALLVLVIAGACGAPRSAPPASPAPLSNTAAPVPSSLAGAYRTTHGIRMVCEQLADGWCDAEVDDTMVIRDAGAGALAVRIELVQTNAHSCTFDGTLTPARATGAATRTWRFQSSGDDEPCALVLEQTADELRLSSDGCRDYCGVRASLHAVFELPPRGA